MWRAGLIVVCVAAVWCLGASAGDVTGMVYVRSEPAGASVFLDDGNSPLGKTPCLIKDITPGRHVFTGKLDGQVLRAEVEVQAGQLSKIVLKPAEQNTSGTPTPPQGELQISSKPPGATVWLDGEARGKTPLALAGIPVGEHVLKLTLDGHKNVERKLAIKEGSNPIEIALAKEEEMSLPPSADAPIQPPEEKPAKKEAVPRTIEIDCPACKGSGLCRETGCVKCGADGFIGAAYCPSCEGRGRAIYMCPACQGQGKLTVGGKEVECRACLGKGAPPCPLCKGKGKISRPNPEAVGTPTKPCPFCDGTGFEQKAKCTVCSGRGKRQSSEAHGLVRYYVVFDCRYCGGDGEGPPVCQQCKGRGYLGPDKSYYPCPNCAGTGYAFVPCRACGGRGFVKSTGSE